LVFLILSIQSRHIIHTTMRIITWNVNGLRAVEKKNEIQNLISSYDPDIVVMQEIKGTPDKFSVFLNSPEPYVAYYNPAEKPGYAGTGAWVHSRVLTTHDVSFVSSFPGDPTANEGRVAHLQIKDKSFCHSDEGRICSESPEPQGRSFVPQDDKKVVLDIFGIYFPN
jgi:exonuclease III